MVFCFACNDYVYASAVDDALLGAMPPESSSSSSRGTKRKRGWLDESRPLVS